MFYRMYLSSVCNRRQWPDPVYQSYENRHGHFCKVKVNNREYCTDTPYKKKDLAIDGAAMKAFMICRNFSHNDGMYPGQRPGQTSSNGVVQGLPVAIGTGRRSNRSSASSYETSSSDGWSSGGNSPRSLESDFDHQMRRATPQVPKPAPRRSRNDGWMCDCRRGRIHAYGRCVYCIQENSWA